MNTFTCTANVDIINRRSNISRKVAQIRFQTEEENPDSNGSELKNYIAKLFIESYSPKSKIGILGIEVNDLKKVS